MLEVVEKRLLLLLEVVEKRLLLLLLEVALKLFIGLLFVGNVFEPLQTSSASLVFQPVDF